MSRNHSARRGFTLLEILIVVVITGMIAAVAMPGFSRAMKGAELRSAVRTLSMAHKYARNIAVLRQTPMALLVDSVAGEVEVLSLPGRGGSQYRDGFLDGREAPPPMEDAAAPGGAEGADAAPGPAIGTELRRVFGREVKVESVEAAGGRAAEELKGIYWVNYFPNGMCDGFRVRLVDANGRRVTVTAEGISGSAEVVWER